MGAKVERARKHAANVQEKELKADTAEIERDAARREGERVPSGQKGRSTAAPSFHDVPALGAASRPRADLRRQ
jgi:hypothetical protein